MGAIKNILRRKTHGYSVTGLKSKCCDSPIRFVGGNEGDLLAIITTVCLACNKECKVSGPENHPWIMRLREYKKAAILIKEFYEKKRQERARGGVK